MRNKSFLLILLFNFSYYLLQGSKTLQAVF